MFDINEECRCHRLDKDCIPSTTVRKRQNKRAPTSSSKRARLEERLDDLVTLLQSQNVQKSQKPEVSPEIQHPWIPKAWQAGRTENRGTTSLQAAIEPAVDDPSGSSNPFLENVVLTSPGTTAYPTPALSASASCLSDLPSLQAEQLLHRFRSLHMKNNPYLYISSTTTANQLQEERPFFWLVIRAICTTSIVEQYELGSHIRKVLGNQLLG